MMERTPLDKSDMADAKRLRWLLNGNGYLLEEEGMCGHSPCSEDEQDAARRLIDAEMAGAISPAGSTSTPPPLPRRT